MAETTRLTATELTTLAAAAFEAAGVPAGDARVTADILVEGDLIGIPTHGVIRVPSYVDRLRLGGINATPAMRVETRAPSLALVDGDNGLGTVVATQALKQALAMAAETGIAYVGCRDSNHFGAMAPYAMTVCEAGLVMAAGTNASMTMPPFGGAEKRMGNNPLCVAAPVPGGPHFILDMAMSVAARGKIRLADREGNPIPEGWAVDAKGRPTTDPQEALKGFLVPFGAHKGSGLALAVDMLAGALSGGQFLSGISSWMDHPEAPQRVSHFFLLIDPGKLIGRDAFADAMGRFRDIVHATQAADADQPVILPGEREQASRARALEHGVEVPADLLAEIEELGKAAPTA